MRTSSFARRSFLEGPDLAVDDQRCDLVHGQMVVPARACITTIAWLSGQPAWTESMPVSRASGGRRPRRNAELLDRRAVRKSRRVSRILARNVDSYAQRRRPLVVCVVRSRAR